MAELMFPNIVGQFQQGQAFGDQRREQQAAIERRSRLSDLAAQAYGADPASRQGILQQAVGVDPQAGLALDKGINQSSQARIAQLSQKAKLFVAMAESGNEQAAVSMYPQLAQEARQLGLGDVPLEYSPQFLPALKQFAAMGSAPGGRVQSRFTNDQGEVIALMADGSMVKTGERAAPNIKILEQEGQVPTGYITSGGRPGARVPLGGTQLAPGEVPFSIDPSLPAEDQAAIRANQAVFATAPDGATITGQTVGGQLQGPVRTPTAAETAGATEAARQGVQLQYLPQQEAVKTQAEVDKERALQGVKPTKAQEAVDTQYGKDYVEFISGGAADANKALTELSGVIQQLENGENLTGPALGLLPNAIKVRTNAQAMAAQETVESTIQRSLRVILGAQFTEKEGERLIARAYNPNLPEEVNARRVKLLFQQLQEGFANKAAAARYYEQHGTLRGFTGRLPSWGDFGVSSPKTNNVPRETQDFGGFRILED